MGNVITNLLKSPLLLEVIVINDGSTDQSLDILSKFKTKITLINFKQNKGKAAAVVAGIKKAQGNLILLVDADLSGFTSNSVKKMLKALFENKADAVLGDLINYPAKGQTKTFYWKIVNQVTHKIIKYDLLTGERMYYKKSLLPYLNKMKNLGYGLEVFLNYEFRKKKMAIVNLENVFQSPKEEKNGFTYATFCAYLKEGLEISKELARQQNIKGKRIIQFQKKYLFQFAKAYIKSGQKWKQIFNKYILQYLNIS